MTSDSISLIAISLPVNEEDNDIICQADKAARGSGPPQKDTGTNLDNGKEQWLFQQADFMSRDPQPFKFLGIEFSLSAEPPG